MRSMAFGFLLFFCQCLVIQGRIHAQCTPDPLAIASGVYPADIPHAISGSPFVIVMTVVVPTDTIVIIAGTNFSVPIDSVGVDTIIGLPSGYQYFSNSHSHFWRGGSKGCMKIEGQTDKAGIYNVVFKLRGHTITFPPYTTADGFVLYDYQYKMYVDDISSFQVQQNFPNPCYTGKTSFTYISASQNIDFRLYDYSGNTLLKKKISGNVGLNTFELDFVNLLGHISNGLYFYSMDDGFEKVTKKMVVDMMP